LPSWEYYCESIAAPLLFDLINYLENASEIALSELNNFVLGEPLLPFQLLLLVTHARDNEEFPLQM